MNRSIDAELARQATEDASTPSGPIGVMAARYDFNKSPRLLGLVLTIDFNKSQFVTCDAWKRSCGGVPRGSFVLYGVHQAAVGPANAALCRRLILARVKDAAPTPVEGTVQQTLFQIHKLQATLDPLTQKELQWGALADAIIGTFYDTA